MSRVTLLVGGSRYEGWKRLSVSRSMRAISGRYSLSVSEKFPGNPSRWPIRPGDECQLLLDGEQIIAGFVDSRSAGFGPSSRTVSVTGRDKTADMVDCAPNIGTFELTGLTALQIGQRVAKPFGVTVASVVPGLKVIDRFEIQPGETAFDCLDRACRLSGVLPMGLPDGTVLLAREGQKRSSTELVEGKNVIAASYESSHEDRFYRYIVGGQHFGNDNTWGEAAASVEGKATDPNIRKSRTAYIRTSSNLTLAQATERAQWEATNRVASGTSVNITVQGWSQENGSGLWEVNTKVGVRIPSLDLDGDFIITEARPQLDDSGTITELTLAPPGSFTPAPEVPDAEQQGVTGW